MERTLDDLKLIIGKRVKFYRKQRRMTQVELADKVGYASNVAISEIENGIKAPSVEMLAAIAKALRVSPSVLVTPINFDGFDKKSLLFADVIYLLDNAGEIPALDIIHSIVKNELEKIK